MKSKDCLKAKRDVGIFIIFTILLTWIIWVPALFAQNFDIHLSISYNLFITIGTFIPSIVGFVLAYVFGGKLEVNSLFKSLLAIRFKVKWLFYIFLFLPIVSAISILLFYIFGNTLPEMQFEPHFIPIVFIYILIFMGPLGEEVGWRGFMLKRMLRNSTPIKAAIMIAIIWSIWHLPLFFINGTTQNMLTELGIISALFGYFLYTTMISLLITLVYVMTNGSIFSSILLHTMGNLSLGVIPIIFIKEGAFIMLVVLCITTIVVIYKYRENMLTKE